MSNPFRCVSRRHVLAVVTSACTLVTGIAPAHAQAPYPNKPITLVVGFPPGSAPDVVARAFGQAIAEEFKQTVIVDNRAGAGGQIAAKAVASSAPDGYTILLGDVGSMAIAPASYRKLPYNPTRDLKPVAEAATTPFVLVTSAVKGPKDFAEFLRASRASKDQVNLATFGPGTVVHFGLNMLADTAGFKAVPVHYRNIGDLITAVISGDVQAAYLAPAATVPQVEGGKLRALAITAESRSPLLPNVPTVGELGYPNLALSGWLGVFVPISTPTEIAAKLGRAFDTASSKPSLVGQLAPNGFVLNRFKPDEAQAYVREETGKWAEIVKKSGFQAD